ncbi:hypothetical protein GOODEAATRI_015507 [Goodea atripinnis]|uniref:Nuclear protein MDM1 n=1 Tax=Goodea atripinnis TaxID=208336 RepID=A0ABV0NAV2_9TELE
MLGGAGTRELMISAVLNTAVVKELRQQALTYRQRAWGTNFSRNHLSQLLSEYNALWEPTDTMDSHTESSTPRLNVVISPELDSRSASCVEALDLASWCWRNTAQESGLDDAVKPTKLKEAWSENTPASISPFPPHKQTPSPQLKPARTKQESLSPAAPPPLTSAQQHGIQGMLRHPDFQHNVMSWRSAASCSAASAVLERAQKRRDNFWGKR